MPDSTYFYGSAQPGSQRQLDFLRDRVSMIERNNERQAEGRQRIDNEVQRQLGLLRDRTDELERNCQSQVTFQRVRHNGVLAELRLLRMWVLGLVINSLLLYVCVFLLAGEVL